MITPSIPVVVLALLGQCFALGDVETVPELDVNKYAGRWYEAYSSLIQRVTFQKDSVCTCATYTLRDDGKITVLNAGRINTPTGEENALTGEAFVVDPAVPGKLKVQFPGSPKGNYWVVKLGPIDAEGQYSYAVVTTPFKSMMWVLVRDYEDFKQNYDSEVLAYLDENRYNWFWNRPRSTYQGSDCLYPDL